MLERFAEIKEKKGQTFSALLIHAFRGLVGDEPLPSYEESKARFEQAIELHNQRPGESTRIRIEDAMNVGDVVALYLDKGRAKARLIHMHTCLAGVRVKKA